MPVSQYISGPYLEFSIRFLSIFLFIYRIDFKTIIAAVMKQKYMKVCIVYS